MKLALGTAQWGLDYGVANTCGRVNSDEGRRILALARQMGMDTLDTAIAYGDSESRLGQLGVQAWRIVSKLPPVPHDCSHVTHWVQEQVQQSLNRLGVRQLYGLLLHRPEQLLEPVGAELFNALQRLKAEGWVQKMGVSVYAPAELDRLFDRYTFDLVQAPLNLLDRRLLDSGWAQQLRSAGVEIHARSVFLQGLLLLPASARTPQFSRWMHIWRTWDNWLAQTQVSALQACLRFAHATPHIDRVVVGVETAAQLGEIIHATDGPWGGAPVFDDLQDERLINPASWSEL